MRVPRLCLQGSVEFKHSGKGAEAHNREQMKQLTAHLVDCRECQHMAGVTIPRAEAKRAVSTSSSSRRSSTTRRSSGVIFDDSGLVEDDNPNERTGREPATNLYARLCVRDEGVQCTYHATGGHYDQTCGRDAFRKNYCTGRGATCTIHGGYCNVVE